MRRRRGFTLVEMLVTLALVGILAMSALPLYDVVTTRLKESELRSALRTLRTALDAYKAAADSGKITRVAGDSGFPPSLEVLEQGVETSAPSTVTLEGAPAVTRLVFLRRVPRDPFFTDASVPAAATWTTRAYGSPPDAPAPGADVFDVASTSARVGSNGLPYNQW